MHLSRAETHWSGYQAEEMRERMQKELEALKNHHHHTSLNYKVEIDRLREHIVQLEAERATKREEQQQQEQPFIMMEKPGPTKPVSTQTDQETELEQELAYVRDRFYYVENVRQRMHASHWLIAIAESTQAGVREGRTTQRTAANA